MQNNCTVNSGFIRVDPEVAATIRAEMARKLVSRQDLADALNVSRAAVHRRVHGEVAFSIDELRIVASLVDRPVSYLLGEEALSA